MGDVRDRVADIWGARTPHAKGTAQGLRDRDLLDTVSSCQSQTATQLAWLQTRIKQAAPQALIAAR